MSDPWWALGMFTAGWVWALAVQWCDPRFRVRRAHFALLSGERCGALKPQFFANSQPTECVLRPRHSGSHKDEHGTRWRLMPRAAKDGEVCEAYRLPTTAEDSGLCARCGMFDYKHQEQRHA